jgi:amino acid transporter
VGGLIQAIIVINDDAYVPQRWQGTLLTWTAAAMVATFNIYFAKHLPLAEGLFCCVHFFAFIPVITVLWVMTPVKQTASSVFTQFTDNGAGWPNMGATVLVGQVSSMFVVLGQDSVAHMAEEVADAGVVVPKAMVISFLGNLPFTFVLLITQVSASSIPSHSLTVTSYAFCIGDISAALSSRTGFPFIYVLQNATKSVVGTIGFVIVVLVLLVMITISALTSSSRQLFAFARDDGLPFSKWLGAVSTSPPAIKIFIRMMTDDK